MHEKFKKPYKPAENEPALYEKWEQSGYFNPDNCVKDEICTKDAEPFSIVLPPPNVTGTLHMGHAAMLAIEDTLIRYHRMTGKRVLWVPGTDHAAIATQSKFEKELQKKEKKTRYDLGREDFLERVEEFAQDQRRQIINQLKAMGSSLDWSREAYTLDEKRYRAVMEAFVRMYHDGLIYRGPRIINWDPKMQTSVSDEEVEREERTGTFYYLTYGPFTIATARPETKFGDKYVVMHPDDERYKEYTHGQQIDLEWINGPVTATIIKDEAIDMELGTGVMTITPWHDATDFEIAQRHDLDYEQIIDWNGKLLPIAEEFAGMHIEKARPLIVEKLEKKGLVERTDDNYTHSVAVSQRGGGLIEPQIKEQWFVDVEKSFTFKKGAYGITGIEDGEQVTLKDVLRKSVENGDITILPEHFEKIYFHWVDNLRPWCISRQIWYGHRIPVWYCGDETYCGIEPPEDEGWEQDPDTLDTWFSSGLWTFSTLGWPDETNDLATYHPTSVLETGYDILPFWVARMILMSGYHIGDVPFSNVYLHGMVRDGDGKKMSKSLGNVLDPLDMIEKFGADATRLSLVAGVTPGNDINLAEERVRGYKHFANKIWNIARFVLENTEDADLSTAPTLTDEQQKLIEEAEAVAQTTAEHIEKFRLDIALDTIYHYTWDRFAAEILEESKPILNEGTPEERAQRQYVLYQLLIITLKTLHPFMPFVTEAIWSHVPHTDRDLLMVSDWPVRR